MTLGLIGRKVGMTQIFAADGTSVPVTVLSVEPNTVTKIRTAGTDGYEAVQLGIEYAPAPPFDCGRPERAAPEILAAVTSRLDRLRADRHEAVQRAAQRL